jgi:hypothetical protein
VEWFERLVDDSADLSIELTFVAETRRRLVAVSRSPLYDDVLRTLADRLACQGAASGKD